MDNNPYLHFSENYFFKKMIPQVNKRADRVFIKSFFAQFLLFILIVLIALYFNHKARNKVMLEEEMERLQSAQFILSEDFGAIGDDLILLENEEKVKTYFMEKNSESLQQLESSLLFFSKIRRVYSQIYFFDEKGNEIIRIYKDNMPERYSFMNINQMQKGELYISPLDLSRKNGPLSSPSQPIVRFGMAVFSSDGKRQGMILLDYNAKYKVEKFNHHFASTETVNYAIIRFDGKYISGFDGLKTGNENLSFADDFPDLWSLMEEKEYVQVEKEEGLFTVSSFSPEKEMRDYLSKNNKIISVLRPEGSPDEIRTSIVSWIKRDRGFQILSYLTPSFLLFCLIFQLLSFITMWILIHRGMMRKGFGVWMESFFQGLEKNPASIVFTDEKGNIQYANMKFQELSGYSSEEVYQQNPKILKSGKMTAEGYQTLWDTISSGNNWSGEFHNKNKEGNFYWVYASISPIFNKKGQIIRYLGIQEDISYRKELIRQLEEKSSTDSLSGLINRRTFFEKMDIEVERSRRRGYVFVLMMIDVDFFKKVNDTYGHQIGDKVLINLSDNLRASLRSADICARIGGEEFIIVLPETRLDHGVKSAERLRKYIEEHPFAVDEKVISYTVSIGVTLWNKDEKLESTINRADEYLYRAKKEGRNRIVSEEIEN
ncbi:MAG: diguanylate cyclase [Spirochaetaceae bacterium]|nr:diguanylate cyclase [Spirochaetaceae bacterium]